VTLRTARQPDPEALEAEVVLIATGRRPVTEDIGLESLGVELDRGYVVPPHDWERLETSVDGVHVVGDLLPPPSLAHVSEMVPEAMLIVGWQALVVEGGVLLLATVDLGGGGVEVEADRLGGVESELGVDRVADGGQSRDGGAALDRGEPPQELTRRAGWKRLADGAKRGARAVLAQ
jgi:hypothetical protein